jgi:class 3 adenylate cyclase
MSLEGFMAPFIDVVERMATGGSPVQRTRRMLATVLFTDLVGSTERASSMGDHAWRDLLGRHESLLHQHVADAGGRVVKMIGDGSLSVFDGPARAIGCASEFAEGGASAGARRAGRGCTAASARCSTRTSPASRCTSARA